MRRGEEYDNLKTKEEKSKFLKDLAKDNKMPIRVL